MDWEGLGQSGKNGGTEGYWEGTGTDWEGLGQAGRVLSLRVLV